LPQQHAHLLAAFLLKSCDALDDQPECACRYFSQEHALAFFLLKSCDALDNQPECACRYLSQEHAHLLAAFFSDIL
jgi:heme oxygenase